MKKFLIAVSLVGLFALGASAQTFQKGSSVVNFGIGAGTYYTNSLYSTAVPALTASYEYGIVDNLLPNGKGSIGVGGLFGYTGFKVASEKVNYLTFLGQGAFHYEFVEKLDTYAGASLGYVSHSGYEGFADGGNFDWGSFVGARYYFTPAFAVMSEVGYGRLAPVIIGVSLKF